MPSHRIRPVELIEVKSLVKCSSLARCTGVGDDVEGWREGCEDCRRRTDPKPWPFVVAMTPPPIITFECEHRIGERE